VAWIRGGQGVAVTVPRPAATCARSLVMEVKGLAADGNSRIAQRKVSISRRARRRQGACFTRLFFGWLALDVELKANALLGGRGFPWFGLRLGPIHDGGQLLFRFLGEWGTSFIDGKRFEDVIHDWFYSFSHGGLLGHDAQIASVFRLFGRLGMVRTAGWFSYRDWQKKSNPG
jgi:hypothetical protein